MKSMLANMLVIYGTEETDWMSFKVCKGNYFTYHHIEKKENGGENEIDNGAILTKKAHDFLHCIEKKNIDIYNQINFVFKKINEEQTKPNLIYLKEIRSLIIKYIDMGYKVPNGLSAYKVKRMVLECEN